MDEFCSYDEFSFCSYQVENIRGLEQVKYFHFIQRPFERLICELLELYMDQSAVYYRSAFRLESLFDRFCTAENDLVSLLRDEEEALETARWMLLQLHEDWRTNPNFLHRNTSTLLHLRRTIELAEFYNSGYIL